MPSDRRARILAALVAGPESLDSVRLCDVSAAIVGLSGAGIMLLSDDVAQGSVCAAGEASALLDKLQFDLGEGPSIDAHRRGHPVLEPDLRHTRSPRWFALTPLLLAVGVEAVFAFPLQVGAIRLGALHLHRDRPGPLDDEQHADAMVLADVAAEVVLLFQSDAPAGRLAQELEVGGEFHNLVHQASGMVAAQLDVTVGQALIRLRAHAFGNGLALDDVAADVVGRRLRFQSDHP